MISLNLYYVRTGESTTIDSAFIVKDSVSFKEELINELKSASNQVSLQILGSCEEIEKLIKEDLESDILKAPHHGSNTSTSDNFLEKVNPRYVIIGVGKNNNFGHPSNVTIENLNKIGTNIFRTDENGEITIKTDGIKIKKINCCIKNKFQNFGINNSKLYILQIGDKNEKNYYLWNYNIWIFNRNRFLLCKFVENKSSKCVF